MLAGLPHSVEGQVLCNEVATSKAIVDIDGCAGTVEYNIARDCGIGAQRMVVSPALLGVQADLADQVVADHCAFRHSQRCARVTMAESPRKRNAFPEMLTPHAGTLHCRALHPPQSCARSSPRQRAPVLQYCNPGREDPCRRTDRCQEAVFVRITGEVRPKYTTCILVYY